MRWNQCITKCFKIQNHLLHMGKWNFSQSWDYRYMSERQTLYITQFASHQRKKSIRLTAKMQFSIHASFSDNQYVLYSVNAHWLFTIKLRNIQREFSENEENMKSGLMLSGWTDFILILFYVSFPLFLSYPHGHFPYKVF